ncbi:MAG: response regulator [Candidatus Kerfeldbacteria bacterium]|nr:response regulator [Candidatus Kerfeldbacteria bacterium]
MPNGGGQIDLKHWLQEHREISDEDFRFLIGHSLSHLRIPLTGVLGYLTMLVEGDFKAREFSTIHKSLKETVQEALDTLSDVMKLRIAYARQFAPKTKQNSAKKGLKRVLHFEDDKMLTKIYRVRFELDGLQYEPRETPAPDPVALVKSVKPDLILMSVIMPEMDGFSATRLLKGDPETRNIPLLFLTNLGQKEDIIKGMSLDAVDYLVSAHYTPWQVVDRVREVLKLPRLKRDEKLYPPLPTQGSRVPRYQDIPKDETINRAA